MPKQPNGTHGQKPPVLSVSTTRLERAAARLAGYRRQALEILSGAGPSGYTTLRARLAGYRRQALEILSGAGPSGYTTLLAQMAQGFTADMLAGLVHDGLATAATETVRAGGRAIEVTRVKITDAGRRTLKR